VSDERGRAFSDLLQEHITRTYEGRMVEELYCGCDENRCFHLDKNAGSHSELRIAEQFGYRFAALLGS